MYGIKGELLAKKPKADWFRFESSIKSNFQRRIVNIECTWIRMVNSKYWCKNLICNSTIRKSLHRIAFENHLSLIRCTLCFNKKIIDAYCIVATNSSSATWWGYCLSLSVNICLNSHINMHFSMQFRFFYNFHWNFNRFDSNSSNSCTNPNKQYLAMCCSNWNVCVCVLRAILHAYGKYWFASGMQIWNLTRISYSTNLQFCCHVC